LISLSSRLARLLLVLWAGSLWSLALWTAPLLFKLAPDRHAAGVIAAGLFRVETFLTLALAVVSLWRHGRQKFRLIYLAALTLLINEFIIKRLLDFVRVNGEVLGLGFGGWHGVSAVLYLVACAAALLVVWNDDFR
jgi:Domain of unknown function (DUF4149)